MIALASRTAWIFDLDGTLTVAVHDYAALRATLGLRPGSDILAATAGDDALARSRQTAVEAWELDHVASARPQPGAASLLETLRAEGRSLAVLTRNTRAAARATLERCGLTDYFEDTRVLGREQAPPKPAPDGVRALLARMGVAPEAALMIGDYLHDLQAGRSAGVATVHLDRVGRRFAEWADLEITSLADLEALFRSDLEAAASRRGGTHRPRVVPSTP